MGNQSSTPRGGLLQEFTWSSDFQKKKGDWKQEQSATSSTVYFTNTLKPSNPLYTKSIDLLNSLGGSNFKISKITLVHPPHLLQIFHLSYELHRARVSSSPMVFSKKWLNDDPETRSAVMDHFEKFRSKNAPWSASQHPIVPCLFGTDLALTNQICQTGFTTLSGLDAGFYGSGFYFLFLSFFFIFIFFSSSFFSFFFYFHFFFLIPEVFIVLPTQSIVSHTYQVGEIQFWYYVGLLWGIFIQ